MKWIKKVWSKKWIQQIIIASGIFFSFLILDVGVRTCLNDRMFFPDWLHSSPIFFSISWICILIMLFFFLPKKIRKTSYLILLVILNLVTLAQMVHFTILDRYFGIYDLFLLGEGAGYFWPALRSIDWKMILILLSSLTIGFGTLKLMKYQEEPEKKKWYYLSYLVIGIILFSSFRNMAIRDLGEEAKRDTFDAAIKMKNVYLDFNHPSKNMEVAGLYEKIMRESYLFVKTSFSKDKKEYLETAENYFTDLSEERNEPNDHTGMFQNKNVVLVLLESIDSWLVTEKIMPTLTMMQETGMNFTNRYAPVFGGGATFNTEFAVNTGLYSLNNGLAAYNFENNKYPYSLANLFKNDGYIVNSLHANNGKFYNRERIHLSFGYEHHYALRDMKLKTDKNYFKDSVLASEDEIYRYIVPEESKFMSFVVSYVAHMPYNKENNKCNDNPYQLDVPGNEALSCIRNLARDTDEFLRIMIERLKEENKLEDTVFILFSDHYAYAYDDQEYVKEQKEETDANLLQNVPFVIWNSNMEKEEVDTLMDSADILPTIANLFGLSTYEANHYLGTDIFSKYHDPFVYFNDYSWYNGTVYYKGQLQNPPEEIKQISEKVNQLIHVNDAILLSDYYSKKK